MKFVLSLVALVLALRGTTAWVFGHEPGAPNMLAGRDWDCEQPVKNHWKVSGATVTTESGDSYTGSQSFRVTNRKNRDSGVFQTVTGLTPGKMYYYSVFVKQLNNLTSNKYSAFRAMIRLHSGTARVAKPVGILPWSRADDNWNQVGGDFVLPPGITTVNVAVRLDPPSSNYLVDTLALTEIPVIPDVKAFTDPMIDQYKKTDITVKGNVDSGTRVTVTLTNHEFGHGISIKAGGYNGNSKYRDFVHRYFNWCVFENDMKWKNMESRKGNPSFKGLETAITELLKHDMTIRGHLLTWDILETNPGFVKNEMNKVLENDALRRVEYMVKRFKGRIVEWDVCNEALHSHFLEARSGNLDIMEKMFRKVHECDPNAKAFLNDYQVIRDGKLTSAITDSARNMLRRGVPVHGIGMQGHIRSLPISIERLWKRLEVVGSAGLQMTVTEFSAHSMDIDLRAQYTEDMLRVFMAHPLVHAVLWWGPTDAIGAFANDHFTFNGYTPNKAGQKMINLLEKEWKTNEKVNIGKTIRGFRGDYTVTYKLNGKTMTKKFKTAQIGPSVFKV